MNTVHVSVATRLSPVSSSAAQVTDTVPPMATLLLAVASTVGGGAETSSAREGFSWYTDGSAGPDTQYWAGDEKKGKNDLCKKYF